MYFVHRQKTRKQNIIDWQNESVQGNNAHTNWYQTQRLIVTNSELKVHYCMMSNTFCKYGFCAALHRFNMLMRIHRENNHITMNMQYDDKLSFLGEPLL